MANMIAKRSTLATAILASVVAPGVAAQASESGVAAGMLEEVVVMARKREENLRDVPVSVTAVSREMLTDRAIVRITDLVTIVPNFRMSLGGLQPSTNLRGFGTYGSQFAQSVGKFVDNVSYSRDFHARVPLFDLENVEVLKGPQVLLYGNSTTAGALNMKSRRPGSSFEANLSATYEFEHEEALLEGGVTIPLNDIVSLRLSGFTQDLDKGWIYNTETGRDEPLLKNRAGRAMLMVEPNDRLSILLKAEHSRVRELGGTPQQARQSNDPGRQLPEVKLDGRRESNTRQAPYFQKELLGLDNTTYQADVDFETGFGTLHSTTAYNKAQFSGTQDAGTGRPVSNFVMRSDYDQFSQELRFAQTGDMWNYVVGGFYEWNNFDNVALLSLNLQDVGIPVPPLSRYVALDQVNKSYSVFGDFTFNITDTIDLSVGARQTWLRQTNDQASLGATLLQDFDFNTSRSEIDATLDPSLDGFMAAVFGGTPHTLNDVDRRESHFQPQVVVQYRPDPNIMFYAKYVKGAKMGGVDLFYTGAGGVSADASKFGPEDARSYEIGVKGITADRKLEYSLTVFDTLFSDLQLQNFQAQNQFTTNVGEAQTRGVEAQIALVPIKGLRIDADVNYLDATFEDFPNAPCTVLQDEAPSAPSPCTQDLSGSPTPFQSEWTGTLSASYEFESGGFIITPGISVNYRSSYYASTIVDPLGKQGGFSLVDLTLNVVPVHSKWKATIFAKNITDKMYKEYGSPTPVIPGGYTVYLSRGSSFGFNIGYEF